MKHTNANETKSSTTHAYEPESASLYYCRMVPTFSIPFSFLHFASSSLSYNCHLLQTSSTCYFSSSLLSPLFFHLFPFQQSFSPFPSFPLRPHLSSASHPSATFLSLHHPRQCNYATPSRIMRYYIAPSRTIQVD